MPEPRPGIPARCAVVVNPVRVADVDAARRTVDGVLRDAGWPAAEWLETTVEDPGAGPARRAADAGAEVVFVLGGDGTVRSCIEGLAGTDAALAVLPAGTGNLLAGNFDIPASDLAAAAGVAVHGDRRRIDVGEVEGRAFAVMAGMGFDAQLLDGASSDLKSRVGPIAYVVSAFAHLRDRPMRVTVQVDDAPPRRHRARTVLVGNVGRLQGGIELIPGAAPDDGTLDVVVISPRHLGHWLLLALAVLVHRSRPPRTAAVRGARVVVTSDRPQPRELDGDVIDPGVTLTVGIRPRALLLCVPA